MISYLSLRGFIHRNIHVRRVSKLFVLKMCQKIENAEVSCGKRAKREEKIHSPARQADHLGKSAVEPTSLSSYIPKWTSLEFRCTGPGTIGWFVDPSASHRRPSKERRRRRGKISSCRVNARSIIEAACHFAFSQINVNERKKRLNFLTTWVLSEREMLLFAA